jgi:hypothetical protein
MTKDELIEKYRYWNVEDFDWWDCTYDDFKVSMTAVGICVDRMYFSGFCSQGDGACFEGCVDDWGLFLQSLGYTDNVVVEFIRNHWSFRVEHDGHYYHENCTFFHTDMPNPDGEDDEWFIERYSPYGVDDFRSVAWLAVLRGYDFSSTEETFRDAFKDHMRQLYEDLEAEHDHLTSDEVVWESLEANDMTDELNQPEEEEA